MVVMRYRCTRCREVFDIDKTGDRFDPPLCPRAMCGGLMFPVEVRSE